MDKIAPLWLSFVVLICLLLPSASYALTAFKVSLNYDNGQFSVTNVTQVELERLPDRDLSEAVYETQRELGFADNYFALSLESVSGELYSVHEEYPKVVYYDSVGYGGAKILNESNDTYFFPFYPEATRFSVYGNGGNQVYTVELASFQEEGSPEMPETEAQEQGAAENSASGGPDYLLIAMIGIALLIVAIVINSRRG